MAYETLIPMFTIGINALIFYAAFNLSQDHYHIKLLMFMMGYFGLVGNIFLGVEVASSISAPSNVLNIMIAWSRILTGATFPILAYFALSWLRHFKIKKKKDPEYEVDYNIEEEI